MIDADLDIPLRSIPRSTLSHRSTLSAPSLAKQENSKLLQIRTPIRNGSKRKLPLRENAYSCWKSISPRRRNRSRRTMCSLVEDKLRTPIQSCLGGTCSPGSTERSCWTRFGRMSRCQTSSNGSNLLWTQDWSSRKTWRTFLDQSCSCEVSCKQIPLRTAPSCYEGAHGMVDSW